MPDRGITNNDNANIILKLIFISEYKMLQQSYSIIPHEILVSLHINRKVLVGNTLEESFEQGNKTTTSGEYSHAEGYGTTASGNASHIEGLYTTADISLNIVYGPLTVLTNVDPIFLQDNYYLALKVGANKASEDIDLMSPFHITIKHKYLA